MRKDLRNGKGEMKMKSSFNHQSKKSQEELAKELLGAFLFGGKISDEAMADLNDEEPKEEKDDYESFAADMKKIYDAFVKAGFDKDQAFVLLNTFIEGAAAAFKH